jgi:hypothetical protein
MDPGKDRFVREVLDYYRSVKPPKKPVGGDHFMEWIRETLERNLLSCAPRNNGIVRVEAAREGGNPDETAADLGLAGSAASLFLFTLKGVEPDDTRPMWVSVGLQRDEVGIMLKLAKGRNAEEIEWTERGTGPDNTVILAMMLLCAPGIYASGYVTIFNDPVDELRRRLYRHMGFEDGKVLRLTDEQSMTKVVRFIANAVEMAALDATKLVYKAGEA